MAIDRGMQKFKLQKYFLKMVRLLHEAKVLMDKKVIKKDIEKKDIKAKVKVKK